MGFLKHTMKNSSSYSLIHMTLGIVTLCLSSWVMSESCESIVTTPAGSSEQLVAYLPLSLEAPKLAEIHLNQPPKEAHQPAGEYLQLHRIKAKAGWDLSILLKSDNELIRPVLRIPLNRGDRQHGGFSTLDGITLIWREPQPLWPVFMLTQTSMPGKNDRDFRPGPPLNRFYQYQPDTGCYQYVSDIK
jgi:hypothetical protein